MQQEVVQYHCDFCGLRFDDPTTLMDHIEAHSKAGDTAAGRTEAEARSELQVPHAFADRVLARSRMPAIVATFALVVIFALMETEREASMFLPFFLVAVLLVIIGTMYLLYGVLKDG